jgi:flagellar protein FliO/FliZ
MMALLGFQSQAYAEQVNSVKDCLEQPDQCSDKPATENNKSTASPNDNSTKESEVATVGITFWDVMKMLISTAFVIALLYFVLKFVNKKGSMSKNSRLIENLGGTGLGGNRSVQIIKVGNRLLVVGVGENIQLIKEIDDEQEYNQIVTDYNQKMEQLVQPSDIVTKVMKKAKAIKTTKSETPFQSMLEKQLDEFTKGRKKLYDEIEKKGTEKK